MLVRSATHVYQDPLEQIWTRCAQRIGFEVIRTSDAYASYDGKGRILIATSDQFDPDDNLGQMIFHELCHALVQGDEGERQLDWGLDNTRIGNPWREHACLRVQAWLSDQFGLRNFLAPTTDYRLTFWNLLGEDPLDAPTHEGGFRERSVVSARLALTRSRASRWQSPLEDALLQTQRIAETLRLTGSSSQDSLSLPSLWSTFQKAPPRHPVGHAAELPQTRNIACQDCAWSFHHRGSLRCRHNPIPRLTMNTPACWGFEALTRLDCLTCGACCREAYDSVEVGVRDPVRKAQPDMVIRAGGRLKLRRENSRCAALVGGETVSDAYHCRIYPDHPEPAVNSLSAAKTVLPLEEKWAFRSDLSRGLQESDLRPILSSLRLNHFVQRRSNCHIYPMRPDCNE